MLSQNDQESFKKEKPFQRPTKNTATVINPLSNVIDHQHHHNVKGLLNSTLTTMTSNNILLYDDQIRALTIMLSSHVSPGIKPLLMMMNGIAGSGKSTVLNSFKAALGILGHQN